MEPLMKEALLPRLLLVALLVAGCASAFEMIPSRETILRNYTVGEPQRVAVGEPIFDVQRGRAVPVFVVTETFQPEQPRVLTEMPTLRPGMRFEVTQRLVKDRSYVLYNPEYHPAWGISVNRDGSIALGWVEMRTGSTIAASGNWPEQTIFRPVEGVQEQEGAFRAQMIYMGKVGTTVRATYREFVADLIRPAFSQPLQFDLAQDSSMAYRSIRVRVLRAETTELEYVVIDDGGLPWLPR